MSSESPTALVVEPGRSRRLAGIVVGSHVLALLPALLLELPGWARAIWVVSVLASLALEWRRHLAPADKLRYLRYDETGWSLEYRSGVAERPVLVQWYAHPWLCVLRFKRPRRTVVLVADAVVADQHRRLRVLLRTRDPRMRSGAAFPL